MFGRKSHMDGRVDTLVGPNSKVHGDITFTGRCHVDGTVKGSVSADPESQSALSIAEDGSVEGGVTVPHVLLNGLVRGDVVASQRVELGPTAQVIGNVYYNLIEMAIGAEINGKLVHQPGGQPSLLERTNRMDAGRNRMASAEAAAEPPSAIPIKQMRS
ncbi:MAG TPA: polymer-forming cytoskeletal protein [Woeseiaceae bacterium]|nr:polymer-forming cytoskeletal protein [Woeseiaceae bacterium]